MEFQFPPNLDPLVQIEETIGFSRMESQFRPNLNPLPQIEKTIKYLLDKNSLGRN